MSDSQRSSPGGILSTEIEAKFLARDRSVLTEIARRREVGRFCLGPRKTGILRTIYLDTVDRRLEEAGVTLRIRRAGPEVEATVKSASRVRGNVHERGEWNAPLARIPRFPWSGVPNVLRFRLPVETGELPFVPTLETRIRRTTILCHLRDDGPACAEISLDEVGFRLPGHDLSGDWGFEVEIELLKGGRRGQVEELARLLHREHGLRPLKLSKLARGRIWTKEIRRASGPRKPA